MLARIAGLPGAIIFAIFSTKIFELMIFNTLILLAASRCDIVIHTRALGR